ncbi:MAG: tetratricopeptide repeat protein [Holophagaceae bacterium]|uniref:Tetratricopeptide repeat protein n=1 Tax=Candidatus Geothrix odensensis TaxID=2954440 RepID=A0A936K5T1_9BACT|nr:tetratricopeptide repeat protein [Candidatus Geothrix odensensis]
MNHLLPSLLALLSLGTPLPAGAQPPKTPQKKAATPPPEAAKAYDAAYAELQKKAYAAALPLYEKALALAPDRAEIWNEYAICLRNLRRYPAAVRAGWRAIQLDGGKTMQPWNAQANTLMETREWQAAQACLEKVEALHKDRAFVAKGWLNLVFRMMAAGEAKGIVELCRRATKLDPGSSLGWIDLGQALAFAGGEAKEAAASVEKGKALAEQQKDPARVEYATQLLKKLQAGGPVAPPVSPGTSWQSLPPALHALPEANASTVALPALVDHHFVLAGGGQVSLAVPEPWALAPGTARPESQFTVTFTIPGTEGFKVFFSPMKAPGNPLGVKAMAEGVVKRLLPISAEKELPLQELASPHMKGYWVLSTDKKSLDKEPAKGDYRHLLTALLDVDGLSCVGTVLTNSKAPAVVDPCVAMFASAKKVGPAVKK